MKRAIEQESLAQKSGIQRHKRLLKSDVQKHKAVRLERRKTEQLFSAVALCVCVFLLDIYLEVSVNLMDPLQQQLHQRTTVLKMLLLRGWLRSASHPRVLYVQHRLGGRSQ